MHAAGAALSCPVGEVVALNCGAPAFMLGRERVLEEIGPRLVNPVNNFEAIHGGRHSKTSNPDAEQKVIARKPL